MSRLSCGIVGLPNVGKSTLFNALTQAGAPSANFPFCTIEPNIGIVPVVDPRVHSLAALSKSRNMIYAAMQFTDIAGLVKGASQGEGLGNQFLIHIQETDAILHVVRCFDDPNIIHVSGKTDPLNDIEVIQLELNLADLARVEQALKKIEKIVKSKPEFQLTYHTLNQCYAHLEKNHPLRTLFLTEEEQLAIRPYHLITNKKVLYIANVDEKTLPSMENAYVAQIREWAQREGSQVLPICAQLEAELVALGEPEREDFLHSIGIQEGGLHRLIAASFTMLGLISYMTTGEKETRAWTIPNGYTAQQAAGVIHTDLEKGFIKAEVISYHDFIEYQGRTGAKEAGKLRVEGKDYIVHDGDVMLFLHR